MLYRETVPQEINSHLPPEIRVIGCIRTTRGFDSKNQCTARTYKYMLPTYSFAPVEKYITKDYRLPDGVIQKANDVLAKYVGTHNFHNFTSGRKPDDASSKRYIMSFQSGEPFVRDGMEFVILTVNGQSFMLHHIRKMIGLMIAIVRGYCGLDALTKSWGPLKMDIPKAPGLGLFLNELFFDGYNKKFGKDGMHEALVWDKYRESLDQFREEYILSHIARSERQESVMLQWLATLQNHKFDVIDPKQEVAPDGEDSRSWWRTKALLKKVDSQTTIKAEASTNKQAAETVNDCAKLTPQHVDSASCEQTAASTKEETVPKKEESMIVRDCGDTSTASEGEAQAVPEPMVTAQSADTPATEEALLLQETSAVNGERGETAVSLEEEAFLLEENPPVTADSADTHSAGEGPASAVREGPNITVKLETSLPREDQTTSSPQKPAISSEPTITVKLEMSLPREDQTTSSPQKLAISSEPTITVKLETSLPSEDQTTASPQEPAVSSESDEKAKDLTSHQS
ncbi:hypothetical protein ACOMHN_003223 [Nucella lapillus]